MGWLKWLRVCGCKTEVSRKETGSTWNRRAFYVTAVPKSVKGFSGWSCKWKCYPVTNSSGTLSCQITRNWVPFLVLLNLFFERSRSSEELNSSIQLKALLYISKGMAERVSHPSRQWCLDHGTFNRYFSTNVLDVFCSFFLSIQFCPVGHHMRPLSAKTSCTSVFLWVKSDFPVRNLVTWGFNGVFVGFCLFVLERCIISPWDKEFL